MFKITHNLNINSEISVLFSDNDMKFSNYRGFFPKKLLEDLNFQKKEFLELGFVNLDYFTSHKRKKICVFKIDKKLSEYDYQKIGGKIYSQIFNFENANLFLDSLNFSLIQNEKFIENVFLGLFSRSYCFLNYKEKKNYAKIKSLSIVSSNTQSIKKFIKQANDIYQGISLTRNLVTMPANILNPKKFTEEILKLKKIGLQIEILNEKKLKFLGLNALLGVGQGSINKSYLAIMKWNGNKKLKDKPLAFVGKGVCFDTGGISLKPAKFMEDMKYDMGGAGTVTGLMKTLALRKSKVNAIGVVGLVENMVDGNSQRPGDVVKSYSGKTIEILNTDAEGRLVLADAIAYTEDRFKPKFIINLATLTGAIIVSLGNEYSGLFSNDDQLAKQLEETSLKDNEKTWRLPLNENFDKLMDSKIADMQNINYSGGAGSITAAQFLQRFIRNKTPWAHLDIAGMAWSKKSTDIIPDGATGYGVKLLNRLVKEHYEK